MFVIDGGLRFSQCPLVLTHDQILAELRAQVGARKFTQKAFADYLKIAPARIVEILKGTRRIQPHEMDRVAAWLNIADNDRIPPAPEGAMPVRTVPLLGDVPGGPWREAVQNSSSVVQVAIPGARPHAYALRVVGDSMDKIVNDGATIIIDPDDRDLFDKWLYVVRNGDSEVTFKQYRESPARLVPCSRNPDHKVIPITDRSYEIIGRVVLITVAPDQAALD
ncbi:LexA family transcriptional regulator [Sphingobium soli]|jgi:repressor LexA|uniref:LexA family transcriptional regulator n=1 Tax=Sphingobium soli TaxID=1591116 RepID=A0ABS8H7I1_9SPHN|nr:LexA family transcriptional regulator [Sphingobium soli]MCC4234505.1 LexA family transcriptional regulator [Sphingobium soli]